MLRIKETRCPLSIKATLCPALKAMNSRCDGQDFTTPEFPCSDYSFGPTTLETGSDPGACADFDATFGSLPGTLTLTMTSSGAFHDSSVDVFYDGVLIAHLDGTGSGATVTMTFSYAPTISGPTGVVVRMCLASGLADYVTASLTCVDA